MAGRSSLLWFLGLVLTCLVPTSATAETYNITLGPGDSAVTIATWDVLDVTAGVTGLARAYHGSGAIGAPFPVEAGVHRVFLFPVPGHFSGAISDTAGAVLGHLDITVVSTTLARKAIADQVGYDRLVTVGVSPDDAPITFATSDPTLLTISHQSVMGPTATFRAKTLKRGTPTILAQIESPRGTRTIARRAMDEFTLETQALAEVIINNEIGMGRTHLTMRPFVENIEFDFSMFAHTATFGGGATSLKVTTTRDFQRIFDAVTRETIGIFYLELDMPPRETMYCFRYQPFQDDPVPIGDSASVNGHGCMADVDEISLCVNDSAPLPLHARPTSTGKHPVKILRKAGANASGKNAVFTAPDTTPDSTTWAKEFDCGKMDQLADKVLAGDHCEKYDVQIEDTLFPDRIQVSEDLHIDLKIAGTIDMPPEYDQPQFRAVALGSGTDLLGALPIGPTTGSGGTSFGGSIELIGTLCKTQAAGTIWKWKRDAESFAYEFQPGAPAPVPFAILRPENGSLGPPSSNDGPHQTDDNTPSPTNRIYDSDRPSIFIDKFAAPVHTVLALRLNANEWVTKNGAFTDCLPVRTWHARVTIVLTSSGWVRSGKNDVGPGHVNLGFDKTEALTAIPP